MTSHEIQREILVALRHGPLDHYQVAADTCQAPFRVRAELKALKRERLVREVITIERHEWELTTIGYQAALAVAQQELPL